MVMRGPEGIVRSVEDCNVHIKCVNCEWELWTYVRDPTEANAKYNQNTICPMCHKPMRKRVKEDKQLTF